MEFTRATRRHFMQLLAASWATFLTGCEIEDITRLVDDARTEARIGVIANTEVAWMSGMKMTEKAFRYYRQHDVDAVVIAGGATKNGKKNQFEDLQQVWQKVFGATSKVRLILDEGQYEINGFTFAAMHKIPREVCPVLTFHGEGKGPLTDEMAFFDPAYNIVYAGSMNAITVPEGYSWNGRPSSRSQLVQCAQGLLVNVYAGKVIIRRLDFIPSVPVEGVLKRGEIYAEDVAPELTLDRNKPFKRETPHAPEFWADTTVQVLPGYEGDKRIFTVKWPCVLKRFTGTRAFSYEVSLSLLKPGAEKPSRPFRRRNVLSEFYLQSEQREVQPVKSVFKQSDLEQAIQAGAEVIVSITPIGAFGDRGMAIVSTPFNPAR